MSEQGIVIAENVIAGKRGEPFFILGPCALQDEKTTRTIAKGIKDIATNLGVQVVFKGSYKKANRTKFDAFHGVGIDAGLELLQLVKEEFHLPVTSDVHEVVEVERAAEVIDLLQIPAALCKHTHLIFAAADTHKPINIKKGTFVSPYDMAYAVDKIKSRGNQNVILTERGTDFGYDHIIVDFRSIQIMQSFGCPVVFDTSHSVRILSKRSDDLEGATPEYIPLLTYCSAAAGVDGLFVETHYSPELSPTDAVSSYKLSDLQTLIEGFLKIQDVSRKIYSS